MKNKLKVNIYNRTYNLLSEESHGTQKRVLFIATGALMSQTTFLQKESIPAIAHLVELRSPQQKEENG